MSIAPGTHDQVHGEESKNSTAKEDVGRAAVRGATVSLADATAIDDYDPIGAGLKELEALVEAMRLGGETDDVNDDTVPRLALLAGQKIDRLVMGYRLVVDALRARIAELESAVPIRPAAVRAKKTATKQKGRRA